MHTLHLRAEDFQVLKFSSAIKMEVAVHLLGNTALLTQHLNSGAPLLFDMDGVLYSYAQLAAWLRPLRRSMFIELMRRAGQEPTTEELTHFCSLNEQNMGAWRKFCDTIADEVFRLTDKRFTSEETRKISVELADGALQEVRLETVEGLSEFLAQWPDSSRCVVTAPSF